MRGVEEEGHAAIPKPRGWFATNGFSLSSGQMVLQ